MEQIIGTKHLVRCHAINSNLKGVNFKIDRSSDENLKNNPLLYAIMENYEQEELPPTIVFTESQKYRIFCSDKSINLNSGYPTRPGAYRTLDTVPLGLPSNCSAYGMLIIFNAFTYCMHIYMGANGDIYFARSVSETQLDCVAPTTWMKLTTTSVSSIS